VVCCAANAPWTRLTLVPDDDLTLASIGFTAPVAAFYRTVS
jgi:hypothetical protein